MIVVAKDFNRYKMPNLRVKCDKAPNGYEVIFYCVGKLSQFYFVVGLYALRD